MIIYSPMTTGDRPSSIVSPNTVTLGVFNVYVTLKAYCSNSVIRSV